MKQRVRKVALAYSGGLDTSIIIPWLRETYGCEVVAVTVDVGQKEETSGLAAKARRTGACDFRLIDAREELARDHLFPVLRAGAIYERDYLLGTATARPLIARKQVETALATGCDAVAHGCTGKGNDQVRFELAYQALAPELTIIAPWREWAISSREQAIDYAAERGIPVPVTRKDPYSRDRNLWHLSHEGGPLEDPAFEPHESMYQITVSPGKAPGSPQRDQVSRGLRDAGWDDPRRRSQGSRVPDPRPRLRPREGAPRAPLRRARLLRPVALPPPRGARLVRDEDHGERHRRSDAEALQGMRLGREPGVVEVALLQPARLV